MLRFRVQRTVRFVLALLVSLIGWPALAADLGETLMGVSSSFAPSYVGPGDLKTYTFWAGLQAYSAAVAATGTQKSVNVRRVTDSVACDVLIATTGLLGNTVATCNSSTQGGISPFAFAGTDATGTWSIAGLTLAATATLHNGDQITGAGVAAGTYVISGASPTWSLASTVTTMTIAAETMTATVGLAIPTAYDQTVGAHNQTITGAAQPFLLQNVFGTLPGIGFNGAATQNLATANSYGVAEPWTAYLVAMRSASVTTVQAALGLATAGGFLGFPATANSAVLATGGVTATANDGVVHVLQGVAVTTAGSSILSVDGVSTTGTVGAFTVAKVVIGASEAAASPLFGYALEWGFASSAFSSGDLTAVYNNSVARGN